MAVGTGTLLRRTGSPGPTGTPVFSFAAMRGGRALMLLTALLDDLGTCHVYAEIHPVSVTEIEPQLREFTFATLYEARRFADEMLLSLEYLGCTVEHEGVVRGH